MSLSAGDPAPDFTLPATPDGEATLSSFLGEPKRCPGPLQARLSL